MTIQPPRETTVADQMDPNQRDDAAHELSPESPESQSQFGLAAMFWVTFAVGLGLAFLQRLDSPDVMIDGVIAIVLAVAIGAAIGGFCKQVGEGVFGATLIAAFGYISVSMDPQYIAFHRMAWALVGAVTGAIGATCFQKSLFACGTLCALAAGALMTAYALGFEKQWDQIDLTLDLIGAPLVGIAVALFVRLLLWLESQHRNPRYITATCLLAMVIIGNVVTHFDRFQ